jgi:hypothetical protein
VSLDVDQHDILDLDRGYELQTLFPSTMNMHTHITHSANARWAVSRIALHSSTVTLVIGQGSALLLHLSAHSGSSP